jgi:starch synthase
MSKSRKLKVLMAGAELAPFAKVGGLGDVMGALPKALARNNVDVKVMLPFYGHIDKRKHKVKLVEKNISIEIDNEVDSFDLYKTTLPGSRVPLFLVKHPIFDFKKVYIGSKNVVKMSGKRKEIKDIQRFSFFDKAIARTIEKKKWELDVVHAHDWHLALLPTFIDEYSLRHPHFRNIKTLFTIHNLAMQGITGLDIVDYGGLHNKMTPALMEDYYDKDGDVIDFMKVGILSADYINTVSPNYAKEILTKEYGEGLEQYLQRRKKNLYGIINGIDVRVFDPQKDKFLKKKYSLKTVGKNKKINKQFLQTKQGLAKNDVPLFGLVSRLVSQKGMDILVPALDKVLAKNEMQVIVLGTGDPMIEKQVVALAKKYPKKVKANITFSLDMAQRIYAGSDFFLMPSRFEPCGLGQMMAMRYGTVPIARKTGGLKDTVKNNKTGVVFEKYTITATKVALEQALKIYNNPVKMEKMVKAGMKEDFSWENSAKMYKNLYKKLK